MELLWSLSPRELCRLVIPFQPDMLIQVAHHVGQNKLSLLPTVPRVGLLARVQLSSSCHHLALGQLGSSASWSGRDVRYPSGRLSEYAPDGEQAGPRVAVTESNPLTKTGDLPEE